MSENNSAMSNNPDPSRTVIREVLREAKVVFVHRKSLIWIGITGFLFGIRSSVGILEVNSHEAASSIFQVAGTMVALVLPAAVMANTFVAKLSDDLFPLILKQEADAQRKRDILYKAASDTQASLYSAWRASVYVLCSFLLSIVTMTVKPICTPDFSVHTPFFSVVCDFSIDSLLLGVSIGFLVIGSLWFFPAIWYAFSLKNLDVVFKAIGVSLPAEARDLSSAGEASARAVEAEKKEPVAK